MNIDEILASFEERTRAFEEKMQAIDALSKEFDRRRWRLFFQTIAAIVGSGALTWVMMGLLESSTPLLGQAAIAILAVGRQIYLSREQSKEYKERLAKI